MNKLGAIWVGASGLKYILTGIYPAVPPGCSGMEVWTAVPDGETPEGLGRTFQAAVVNFNFEPIQKLEKFEDIPE